MPPCASGPVLTVSRPSLNGAGCDTAGAGKLNVAAAAPAAVVAMNLRRVSLRDIDVLPLSARAGSDDFYWPIGPLASGLFSAALASMIACDPRRQSSIGQHIIRQCLP